MSTGSEAPLSILQVSLADRGGGAERVALQLHRLLREAHHDAWLAVGRKLAADEPGIVLIPAEPHESSLAGLQRKLVRRFTRRYGRLLGGGKFRQWLHWLSMRTRSPGLIPGRDCYDFPGTWSIPELMPKSPEILHLHTLHGDYFDLRALPHFSHMMPVFVTLHDTWLFTGGCRHYYLCEGWRRGCGVCPETTVTPMINPAATADNYSAKESLYRKCHLFVTSPSRWLLDHLPDSILSSATVESRVIPNGVDQEVFHPGEAQPVRQNLSIPQDAFVVLFVATSPLTNFVKGFAYLLEALRRARRLRPDLSVEVLCVGGQSPEVIEGKSRVRFFPPVDDPRRLADYYAAADVHLQPSLIDTFPTAVLEALSCGTPVVASAVGGIPEQIHGLRTSVPLPDAGGLNCNAIETATGILVPPTDSLALTTALFFLAEHPELRKQMSANAARDARERFEIGAQCREQVAWYRDVLRRYPHPSEQGRGAAAECPRCGFSSENKGGGPITLDGIESGGGSEEGRAVVSSR